MIQLLSLLFLTYIVSTINADSLPCSTSKNDDVQRIINLIQKRFNIRSLSCTYTVIRTPGAIISDDFFRHCTEDFIYQDGNFVVKETSYPNIPPKDEPKNLFELLVQNTNKKAREDLQGIFYTSNFYYYQGTPYERYVKHYKDGRKFVTSSKFFVKKVGTDGDPRCLFGYFGRHIFSIYAGEDNYLPTFMNLPGNFYYYEKNGYQILWHQVPEGLTPSSSREIEVWVDSNENIVKLKEGYFVARTYHHTNIKQALSETSKYTNEITCDYPVYLTREYEFSEFIEIDNDGARLPLKAKVTSYLPDVSCQKELEKIHMKWAKEKKNLTREEILIHYASCNEEIEFVYDLSIHENTLKVNENIPETELVPPPPDFDYDSLDISIFSKNKEGQNYIDLIKNPLFIFSTICTLLIILSIFITRKYFGWPI